MNFEYSTIMASNLVVSEFLCFTLNKVGKSPAKNVKAVLLDFYNEDEMWSAKALLHGELSKLTSDELPRLVHRKGDKKSTAGCGRLVHSTRTC